MPDLAEMEWRVGTKVGRTLYAVVEGSPLPDGCDDPGKLKDVLIGMMDTPELAAEVVYSHNLMLIPV